MVELEGGGGGGWWYPPNMRHISFPTGAATEAKAACDDIARMLDRHLQARPTMATSVRDGWEGAYREEFDEAWRIQEIRLVRLKEDLQTLASRIETAMENVTAENDRRAGLREQYREEHWPAVGAS
ncbi:MAG: hypothetical protein ACLFXM_10590 [Acidimicrobiia bacterium]